MIYQLCLLYLSFYFTHAYYIQNGKSSHSISKFAFGSCFNNYNKVMDKRFDIFSTIESTHPDLFIWLGDVTYLDDFSFNHIIGKAPDYDYEKVKSRYNDSFTRKEYKQFREKTPIIGMWDDHDFEYNNAKGNTSNKDITKQVFLDFLEEPKDSLRRKSNKGLYTSYSFGEGYKSFKVILLDLRYDNNKDSLMSSDQWNWLEAELSTDETFTFITSGIEFLPHDRFFGFTVQELWKRNDRERLVSLIGKKQKSGVFILSGDVHYAQLLKTFCIHPDLGYHLNEFTSSGLSHHAGFAQLPVEYLLPNYYANNPVYDIFNFGMIELNWGKTREESSITVKIYDINKITRIGMEIPYTDVVYSNRYTNNTQCREMFNATSRSFSYYYNSAMNHKFIYLVYISIMISLYKILKFIILFVSWMLSCFCKRNKHKLKTD